MYASMISMFLALVLGIAAVRPDNSEDMAGMLEKGDLPADSAFVESTFSHSEHDCVYPAGCLASTCAKTGELPVSKTNCHTLKPGTYDNILDSILDLRNRLNQSCHNGHCEVADFAGCILRLVGHDLMDYEPHSKTGGNDACIDFSDIDNKGLYECLVGVGEFNQSATVEAAYQHFCDEVSLADFLVVAAEAVMMMTRPDWDETNKVSPSLNFKPNFKWGRRTALACDPGPLPNPDESCDAVKTSFVDSLNLTWREATALMGVHSLGKASAKNSGFVGYWTSGADAALFDNTYYINLAGAGWVPAAATPNGRMQWVRADENAPTNEMMLNTDMCLGYNTASGVHAEKKDDGDCCLWYSSFGLSDWKSDHGLKEAPSICFDAGDNPNHQFDKCCAKGKKTCGNFHMDPIGAHGEVDGKESVKAVLDFAKDDNLWIQTFKEAWKKVTVNNNADLLFSGACVETPEVAP